MYSSVSKHRFQIIHGFFSVNLHNHCASLETHEGGVWSIVHFGHLEEKNLVNFSVGTKYIFILN